MIRKPSRRRQYLIGGLQYRLLTLNFVYFVSTLFIFVAALFGPLIISLHSDSLAPSEERMLAAQFLALHSRVWPPLLLVFVLLSCHSVVITHRIAGPLYRFRQVFKAIMHGNLSGRANIRKKDYLKAEAACFNAMIDSLNERVRRIETERRGLHVALDDLQKGIAAGRHDDIARKLESFAAHLDRLGEVMDEFKTTAPRAKPPRSLPAENPPAPGATRAATGTDG